MSSPSPESAREHVANALQMLAAGPDSNGNFPLLAIYKRLRSALAALDAAGDDTRRLDWLGGEVFTGATNVSGRFADAFRRWDGSSDFRTALDAAMASAPAGGSLADVSMPHDAAKEQP